MKRWIFLAMIFFALNPTTGLGAVGNGWQPKAVEAISLVHQGGIDSWYKNLPMLWSEPDSIRHWFGPKIHQDKLEQALALFKTMPEQASDNQVALAWAISDVYLGRKQALDLLSREDAEGGVDLRLHELDMAMYLREWEKAEQLADELESEGVQSSLTYRRAVIAGVKGQRHLSQALWHEAIAEGLPITQAVYKELVKAGLSNLVNQPKLASKLKNYIDTMSFIEGRTSLTSAIISEAYQRGITAYEAGRYEEAVRDWRGISGSAEMRLSLEYMIGQALNHLKRYDESETLWRETIKGNPAFFLGYRGLAEALRGKGEHQKAESWLKTGFRRTNSVFLLNNTAVTPSMLNEAQGWTGPGSKQGYQYIDLGEESLKDADSLWVSWNYGHDWLLYPFFNNRLALPMGKEYWLKGTGASHGLGYPDLVLPVRAINKPNVVNAITVNNTGLGEEPSVSGEWSTPVELRFEYWRPGEPRFVIHEAARSAHRFVLENAEPGRIYHYRAYVTRDGNELYLTEGEFSTEEIPFWVGMGRPAGLTALRENKISVPIKGEGLEKFDNMKMRWAVEGEDWSAWSDLHSMVAVSLSPVNGRKVILFQFKDPKGRISPTLSETALLDREPPRFSKQHWQKNGGEHSIKWQTDEPSLAQVWVRINNQWRLAAAEDIYNTEHRHDLPEGTEKVQVWAEDRAGNLSVGFDETKIDFPPITLRINGGDPTTSERLVHLSLAWVKKPANTFIRFSNNGKLWGPWREVCDSFQWRLDTGEGEKIVYAQIRQDENRYEIKAKITLDQTPPSLSSLSFKTTVQGETSLEFAASKATRARFYWGTGGEKLGFLEETAFTSTHHLNLGRIKDVRYVWRLELQDEAGNLAVWTDGWLQCQSGEQKIIPIDWRKAGEPAGRGRIRLQFDTPGDIPLRVRLRNQGGSWEAWRPVEKSFLWTLKSGFEHQWVEAQFMDADGNISPVSRRLFRSEIRPARLYALSVLNGKDGSGLMWRADKQVRGWMLIERENAGKYQEYSRESFADYALEGTISLKDFAPGNYRMQVYVEDHSGNWNWSPWIEYS
ncbi:MAG TPA: tetratricopeptide repeat protein, partial [Bacillota bacterium]|nr:tetratricopeptide repeat protein [Bacillota bacterium]